MAELVQSIYANSLFEVVSASKINGAQSVSEELAALKKIFDDNMDYIKLFCSPSWSKSEKNELLNNTFKDKLSDYTLNFLKLLVDNGRFNAVNSIIDEYIKIHEANSGIMQITAITATAMDKDLENKLIEKLSTATGKKVRLNSVVDKAVIGGIKLRYDNTEIDSTVQSKLEEIKQIIKTTSI